MSLFAQYLLSVLTENAVTEHGVQTDPTVLDDQTNLCFRQVLRAMRFDTLDPSQTFF